MGIWEFEQTKAAAVRINPTQKGQFNNDEVSLPEALVRETIQNSTDAAAVPGQAVKVRFGIRHVSGAEAENFRQTLQPLLPHYAATGIDSSALNAKEFNVLAIEDFGTRGLTGSLIEPDLGNFDRFWRVVGDSGKQGTKGGRWGLGKLVYSSSSAASLFFGLTVTQEQPAPSLLGQIVLRTHRIGNIFYSSHGFFFDKKAPPHDLQQPLTGESIRFLAELGGLKRKNEPGLSLIIPFLASDIDEKSIIAGVISNYFFPILAGQLVVEVGDVVIDKARFFEVVEKYKPLHPIPFDFVKQISDAIDTPPAITALTVVGRQEMGPTSFTPEQIAEMKRKFVDGVPVRVRVRVELKPKKEANTESFIDLYIRSLPENAERFTLVARNAITLSQEQRYVGGIAAYAALIAQDGKVCSFLGDAETPSHTRWDSQAEKLRENWRSPGDTIRAIRKVLRQFFMLVAEVSEEDDEDLLADFFSILDEADKKKGKKPKTKKPKVDLPPRERAIVIRERKGGFEIAAGPAAAKWTFPRVIRVRVAYDTIGSNPFNRHSPFDFDLAKDEIDVQTSAAAYSAVKPNIIKLTAQSAQFRLECSGFDLRRDIVVDARAV